MYNKFELETLTDHNNYYLSENKNIVFSDFGEIEPRNVAFFKIDEISFEDKAPRKEALENVLSAMKIDGINFIYLITGDSTGVHFYYGVAKDQTFQEELDLNIHDIGKYILEPSIKGNFRGSKTREVKPEEKKKIISNISNMKYYSMLEGVPGSTKDNEKFQGVNRLVDVMLGDEFGFMIVASPINYDEIKKIENDLYEVYTKMVPLSKISTQDGYSTNEGKSQSVTKGTSDTTGKNHSTTSQEGITITDGTNNGTSTGKSTNTGRSKNENKSSSSTGESSSEGTSSGKTEGKSHSESRNTGGSESSGTNQSNTTSTSKTEQSSNGSSTSNSTTTEHVDKRAEDWIKYLNDVILPRLDYGTGKGIFITTSFMFSQNKASLKKLENTAISLYSGETGNKVPLKAVPLENIKSNKKLTMLKNFQLPCGRFENKSQYAEIHSAWSQFVKNQKNFSIGNWITTNELAMIAGLPQKDVVGLELKEEVEFGLNFKEDIKKEDRINLGGLVQSGNIINGINVFLDKNNLDKHLFITGVTGSGKTTTCHKILIDSNLPFLIIEPAKTEYRILTETYDDLIVFTLGKDTITPFRLNPFEFFRHESITSRVDMIKASIEASFDMEAAIPQLIESAIYECYEDYGWDISSNKNKKYGEHAFDDGIYAFPTLQDLINKVDKVVQQQGFDERLKNDYIGSIKARLLGLVVGSKGLMLNTKRSIDFEDLLTRRVVLEFEEIRSITEKSLIMGFVLTNLIEAIKANFMKHGTYRHITLIEEAHRLLSKFMPGDSPNKKHGVETFTDMLAEIRKYGEALIIVDQIPNKLTPEVLKNTNTKIVHRLFAEDDKDAIGNTIVLNKEQKEFLSNLETGRAIVFTQGFDKALQVQIENITNTTSQRQIEESYLSNKIYQYYSEYYKRGIILGTQYLTEKPSLEEVKQMIEMSRNKKYANIVSAICSYKPDTFVFDNTYMKQIYELCEYDSENNIQNIIQNFCKNNKEDNIKQYQSILCDAIEKFGQEQICRYVLFTYCLKNGHANSMFDKSKYSVIENFIKKCKENGFSEIEKRTYKDNIIDLFK